MKYNLFFTLLFSLIFFSNNYSDETVSRIPIHSFPFLSNQRFAEIQIDEKQYLGLIDTGSVFSMIRKDVLNGIKIKNYISRSEFISVNGNKYMTPNFMIPRVSIGDFCLDVPFKEEDANFWMDGCTIGSYSFILSCKLYLMYQVYREAVIGMDLFKQFACIFDFPHSSIFLAENMSCLIGDASEFCLVPFEMGKAGAVSTFETNIGKKNFLFDSAASASFMRTSQESGEYVKSTLRISGVDFGEWNFKLINITNEFDDIDGILGIDFFKSNMIGFDFKNKTAYIQSVKLGSKERFTYWIKSYFGK